MSLTLMLELVILTVSLGAVGFVIYKSRKAGATEIPWEKIRPILTETFIRVKELQDAGKLGYQAIEDYAVVAVHEQVMKADFLTKEERSLISKDLIRSIIGPRLREIYNAQQSGQ